MIRAITGVGAGNGPYISIQGGKTSCPAPSISQRSYTCRSQEIPASHHSMALTALLWSNTRISPLTVKGLWTSYLTSRHLAKPGVP